MKWEKIVEKELRVYLSGQVDLEFIEKEIGRLRKEEASVRTTYLDDMPKSRTIVSFVEKHVVNTELSIEYWELRREALKTRIKDVECALNSLTPILKKIVKMNYFELYLTDSKIAKELDMSLKEYYRSKKDALQQIFLFMRGRQNEFNINN